MTDWIMDDNNKMNWEIRNIKVMARHSEMRLTILFDCDVFEFMCVGMFFDGWLGQL